MLVASKDLTAEAKVIIYPGSRKFFPNEIPVLREQLDSFCCNLEGIDICYEITYDRFLIFMISEATSLDLNNHNLLVDFVLTLEKRFDLSLLDKVNVCFNQGQYVQLKEIPAFKLLIKNKGVSKKTVVFDNMINTKSEYDELWEVPAGESWLSHFF